MTIEHSEKQLAEAISSLAESIIVLSNEKKTEFEWFRSHLLFATKQDLDRMECRIMSAISVYSERVNAKLDNFATSVDGLVSDVAFLKAKITALQNSTGTVTAEDQALLDSLENRIGALATKIGVLDSETDSSLNPVPPVEPTP